MFTTAVVEAPDDGGFVSMLKGMLGREISTGNAAADAVLRSSIGRDLVAGGMGVAAAGLRGLNDVASRIDPNNPRGDQSLTRNTANYLDEVTGVLAGDSGFSQVVQGLGSAVAAVPLAPLALFAPSGEASQRAEAEGLSEEAQIRAASNPLVLASGASEVLTGATGKLLKAVPLPQSVGIIKKTFGKAAETVVKKVDPTPLSRTLYRMLKSGGKGALEEGIQEIGEVVAQNIALQQEGADVGLFDGGIVEAGTTGGIVGAIVGAAVAALPGRGRGSFKQKDVYKALVDTQREIVGEGGALDQILSDTQLSPTTPEVSVDEIPVTGFKKWKNKWLSTRGSNPRELDSLSRLKRGRIDAISKLAEDTAVRFNRAVEAEYGKGMSKDAAFLTGTVAPVLRGEKDPTTLKETTGKYVLEMRQMIDRMTDEIKALGITNAPLSLILDENKGAYLTRSYRVFFEKNYTPSEEVMNRAALHVQERMRDVYLKEYERKNGLEAGEGEALLSSGDADVKNYVGQRATGDVNFILGKAKRSAFPKDGRSTIQNPDEGTLKKRVLTEEDMPIRDLLGEHKDPRINFLMSMFRMANLTEELRFNEDFLLRYEDVLFTNEPRAEFAVPVTVHSGSSTFESTTADGTVVGGRAGRKGAPQSEQQQSGLALPPGPTQTDAEPDNRNLPARRESALPAGRESDLPAQRFLRQGEQRGRGTQATEGGNLQGRTIYTTPELAEMWKQRGQDPGFKARAYFKAVSLVKEAKTTLSPITHIRNLVSGVGFAVAQGHINPFRPSDVKARMTEALDLVAAHLSNTATPDQQRKISYLVSRGILGSSIEGTGIQELRKDAEGNMQAYLRAIGGEQADGVWSSFMKAQRGGRSLATTLYQNGDNFAKVFGFLKEQERYRKAFPEWTQEQVDAKAAEIISDTYQNYGKAWRAVQEIRRLPVASSFIAFPLETARIATMTAKLAKEEMSNPATRAIGIARLRGAGAALAAPFAAQMLSRLALGISDDDDDAMREMLAPWQKNSTILYTSADKTQGKVSIIDFSYTDPWSYLKEPLNAVLRNDGDPVQAGIDALGAVMQPFVDGDILATTLVEAAANKDSYGNEIYLSSDPTETQIYKRAMHILAAFEPGALRLGRDLAQSTDQGGVTKSGRVLNPEDLLATMVTGIKVQEIDLARNHGYMARESINQMRDMPNRDLRQTLRAASRMTDEEVYSVYSGFEKRRKRVFEEAHKQARAAMRWMPERQVKENLKGISGGVNDVLLGNYKPYDNKKLLDSFVNFGPSSQRAEREKRRSAYKKAIRRYREGLRQGTEETSGQSTSDWLFKY